jgi:PhoPQ-activated pathogenicity-related protein
VIWVYRTLLSLNVVMLALSLFLAVPTLVSSIDLGATTVKLFLAAGPIPQVAGLWFAGKLRERDFSGACWLLFGQFVIVFGLFAGATLVLLAAFPE